MRIRYNHKKFNPEHRLIIDRANAIIAQYQAAGYTLTLRQLYYQFIGRDLFPDSWIKGGTKNNVRNYQNLGRIVSDGRRAGLIDWAAIEDRTRNLQTFNNWDDPAEIVGACAEQYNVDWWAGQTYRPEVWVEKEALVGVLQPVCTLLRVPYFACRGYTSDSEIQAAAQRLAGYQVEHDQIALVIHLGDHDPSGMDMTRDIFDRIKMFASNLNPPHDVEVRRIALNWDQIQQYEPPPNPAKTTDARYRKYEEEFGDASWELDALDPAVIAALIEGTIRPLIDAGPWDAARVRRDEGRKQLRDVSNNWDDIVNNL